MEGTIHLPLEISTHQGIILISFSQDSMETMKVDTIIIYNLWLQAELRAGQAMDLSFHFKNESGLGHKTIIIFRFSLIHNFLASFMSIVQFSQYAIYF